jgi:multidrug efflux pump subunit AcrA (membrane-fusion protein)/YHS domain-containing protein
MTDEGRESRRLMYRWATLFAVLIAFAFFAAWRMEQARMRLHDASTAGGVPTVAAAVEPQIEYWTCTMHPQVQQNSSGECPICGMDLVAKYAGASQPGVIPAAAPALLAEPDKTSEQLYMCTMPDCGDTPSTDPYSRCPVCGMKRQPINLESRAGESELELTLGERARKLAEVAVEQAGRQRLFKHIRTVGKVSYDETRHKLVTSWIGGRIDRLFADYTGMVVKKNDHLVEIYSPELVTAQEELNAAIRVADSLKAAKSKTRERAQRLVVSAERRLELLGVKAEQIEAIKEKGAGSTRLTIHAPIGGTIISKPAIEGMYVKTGDPLYEIADLEYVWLMLDLYESDLPWIAPLQKVRVTADALPGREFIGQIAFVDPVVHRVSRTIKIRVNVHNKGGLLKPEMFVNAEVSVALADDQSAAVPKSHGAYVCPMHPWDHSNDGGECSICQMNRVPIDELPGYRSPREAGEVLTVPREAVIQTGKRALVYVESAPGTYRMAEIEIGSLAKNESGREFYPVREGLTGAENVVTRGNFAIDSQMQLASKPSLFNPSGGAAGITSHRHSAAHGDGPSADSTEAKKRQVHSAEQTVCPVMGGEIDSEVFTDFHGVRVHFCCPPCADKFNDQPEIYLPKLPDGLQRRIREAMKKPESEHEGHGHG